MNGTSSSDISGQVTSSLYALDKICEAMQQHGYRPSAGSPADKDNSRPQYVEKVWSGALHEQSDVQAQLSLLSSLQNVLVGVEDSGRRPAAVSNQFYRIILPIDNVLPSDQQLRQISLLMAFPGPPCAEVPVLLYRIKNTIVIKGSSRSAQGSVSNTSSPALGFDVPATGKLNFGCGLDQLHLSFSRSRRSSKVNQRRK